MSQKEEIEFRERYKQKIKETNKINEALGVNDFSSGINFIFQRDEIGQDITVPEPPEGWKVADHSYMVKGQDGDGPEAKEYIIELEPKNAEDLAEGSAEDD